MSCEKVICLKDSKTLTYGVFKLLVPLHVAAPRGVDPTTGRANVRVLLHHVHRLLDCLGLEVN